MVALAAGAAVGFINGFLVVQQKCEPFIITLGMGILLKGICQQITNAHPLGCKNPSFMDISNAKFFGSVPSLVVYMLLLGAAFYYLMRYTSYGRNCYAIGGNYDVAKYSGIKVIPIKWTAVVISGMTATLAGVLLSSRMNTGNSVYGDTTGMLVNCGVVIGGTSMKGGEGSMVGTLIGIFIIGVIANGLNLLGVAQGPQRMVKGLIIVVAVIIDVLRRRAAESAR